MATVNTAPFFNAVIAATSQASGGITDVTAAVANDEAAYDISLAQDDGTPGLSNTPSAPDLAAAASLFHERVSQGLDPDKIPAPVQEALMAIQAGPKDREAAGRAYFGAVREAVGDQIVRAALLMLSRDTATSVTEARPAEKVASAEVADPEFDVFQFLREFSIGYVFCKIPGRRGDYRVCSVFKGHSIPPAMSEIQIDRHLYRSDISHCNEIYRRIFRQGPDDQPRRLVRVTMGPVDTVMGGQRSLVQMAGRDFVSLYFHSDSVDWLGRECRLQINLSIPCGHSMDILDSIDRDPAVLAKVYEQLFAEFAQKVHIKGYDVLEIAFGSEIRRKKYKVAANNHH